MATPPLFEISGLHAVTVKGGVEILKGLDLTVVLGAEGYEQFASA